MAAVAAFVEARFAASGAVDAATEEVPRSISVTGLVTVAAFQVLGVLQSAAKHDQPSIQPDGKTEVFHFHTAMAI